MKHGCPKYHGFRSVCITIKLSKRRIQLKKRINPCLQKWRLFHLAAFSFFVAIALVNGLFWIHATKQFLYAQCKLMLRWRTGNHCSKTFLTFQTVSSVKIFILYVWNNVLLGGWNDHFYGEQKVTSSIHHAPSLNLT